MSVRASVLSLFAIVIVLTMILPIPPSLLDVLIAFNISIALIVFLNSINIKEALDFSVFPSLLLVTTLLRLALNISTTRQILTGQGENVRIVYTFGNFVIGSNIVVGVMCDGVSRTLVGCLICTAVCCLTAVSRIAVWKLLTHILLFLVHWYC